MDENKQPTVREEYDDERVVEKGEYIEDDERYIAAQEPEEPEEPEEEEIDEEDLPYGLEPTFVKGTNRYQLMGAICGYAGALLVHGLLGIAGLVAEESGSQTMIFSTVGIVVGYIVGCMLTKRKKAEFEAERAAKKAQAN